MASKVSRTMKVIRYVSRMKQQFVRETNEGLHKVVGLEQKIVRQKRGITINRFWVKKSEDQACLLDDPDLIEDCSDITDQELAVLINIPENEEEGIELLDDTDMAEEDSDVTDQELTPLINVLEKKEKVLVDDSKKHGKGIGRRMADFLRKRFTRRRVYKQL